MLAKKSGINTNGKSLTIHCFRKMFLSASIDSGIGLTAGKKMCGKAIPQSDDTYLTTVQLRKKFIQLKKILTIQQVIKTDEKKRIERLETAITQLQQENISNKTVSEVMTKKVNELEKKLKEATDEIWNLNLQVQPMMSTLADLKSLRKKIKSQQQKQNNDND